MSIAAVRPATDLLRRVVRLQMLTIVWTRTCMASQVAPGCGGSWRFHDLAARANLPWELSSGCPLSEL